MSVAERDGAVVVDVVWRRALLADAVDVVVRVGGGVARGAPARADRPVEGKEERSKEKVEDVVVSECCKIGKPFFAVFLPSPAPSLVSFSALSLSQYRYLSMLLPLDRWWWWWCLPEEPALPPRCTPVVVDGTSSLLFAPVPPPALPLRAALRVAKLAAATRTAPAAAPAAKRAAERDERAVDEEDESELIWGRSSEEKKKEENGQRERKRNQKSHRCSLNLKQQR